MSAAVSSGSGATFSVPATSKELFAAHLTLHPATLATLAVAGNFSAPRAQEIAAVYGGGQWLSLLRPHDTTGHVQTICQTNVFGVIRSIATFRLIGGQTDYLVVGSDSGRISILQYNVSKNAFVKVHEETYGKSGVRRMIPGEYLAVDPRGRAVMIGAFEKQKLVYILNRDQATNLTISSPLEAHKSNMLTYSIAALDVVMDNPIFACIEVDYNDTPSPEEEKQHIASAGSENPPPLVHKYLTFYELDLSLNHVTRKYNQQIDNGANLLISVPGGESGPGGVLICCENCIYYKHHENTDEQKKRYIRCEFPRRFGFDSNEKGVLITAHATHVQKGLFFFLLQTEYGDLYKVTLVSEEDTVHEVVVKYFDTIPVSTAIVVLKTGFLFNTSESGNQYLWQFQGIGDDDDVQPFTTSRSLEAGGDQDVVIFKPRIPTNLALIDEVESAAPIIDMKVADLAREYTPQIYTLVGRGSRSSLRVLRHGLAVSEIAVSEMRGVPSAVWAIKKSHADPFMTYIVVSFVNATIVLLIGETVVEVKDSGILETTNTLHVSLLADGSILQIHPAGIRHIRPDKPINEWKTPGKKAIQCCAANEKQIVVALTGGEIVYFELDTKTAGGNIIDLQRKDMGNDVAALAIAPVPEGRQRATFLAVGLYNNLVRILSLDPTNTLGVLGTQAVPAQPTSLQLVSMASHTAQSQVPNLYLYVGLTNGILMRSRMDESAGTLSDSRKRFLGTRPVRLHRITVREQNAVVALSSRNWLSYVHQNRFQMVPLSYEILEHAAPFASEQCPEGIVCISANTLRIIFLDKIGELFNQTILPLKNTPRKILVHPVSQQIVVIETDHNAYTEKQKQELRKAMKEVEDLSTGGNVSTSGDVDMETGEEESHQVKPEAMSSDPSTATNEVFTGAPHAGEGAWSSSIRIIDPLRMETVCLLSLEENEAAFSECILQFSNDPEWYLVVGTVQNLFLAPKKFTSGFLHVYRFAQNHTQLHFLHKTPVTDIPLALAGFQKKLAVGVGPFLRLYELGKKKLLRKCENKNFPSNIQSIQVSHDRLYVGDLSEGFHFCLYKKQQNELEIIADQIAPRYLTAQCLLDFDTVAGADKFGNIFISRLAPNISSQFLSGSKSSNSDQTIATLMNKYGKVLSGAQHKLTDIANFYVGETVMALQKVALVPGSSEVIVYGTLMGGIGVLLPFTSREDVEFFTHLEMHLRSEPQTSSLVGRDHLAYRGYYFPVKNIFDGDLCEMFNTHLDEKRQGEIAEELVCTSAEVARRLEDLRNRVL